MGRPVYLSSKQLAERWHLAKKTLANWRSNGKGPPFIRHGNRILYRVDVIEAIEKGWPSQTTTNRNSDHE